MSSGCPSIQVDWEWPKTFSSRVHSYQDALLDYAFQIFAQSLEQETSLVKLMTHWLSWLHESGLCESGTGVVRPVSSDDSRQCLVMVPSVFFSRKSPHSLSFTVLYSAQHHHAIRSHERMFSIYRKYILSSNGLCRKFMYIWLSQHQALWAIPCTLLATRRYFTAYQSHTLRILTKLHRSDKAIVASVWYPQSLLTAQPCTPLAPWRYITADHSIYVANTD